MPDYPTGQGRDTRSRSRGAVVLAYVETDALDRDCAPPPKGCGVKSGDFCCFSDGSQKHVACISRTTGQAGHSSPVGPGEAK